MLKHKVHLLSCYFLCCDNQVSFIFAVLIVNNNDKLALAKEVGADIVINGREVDDVPGLIKESLWQSCIHFTKIQLYT